ncbi:MAG: hypothetical protein ACJ0BK_01920 [Coraliomargaritaceae bacterium]
MIKYFFNYLESIRRTLRLANHYRSARSSTIILQDREVGIFSIYQQVLGALAVSKLIKSSLRIKTDKGNYFTNERPEPGWWNYYFENDIYLPEHRQCERTINIEPSKGAAKLTHLGNAMPRRQAFQLTRLLKLQPDVLNMIDAFAGDHFAGKETIGIHYRGTDKVHGRSSEANHVSYTKIYEMIKMQKPETMVFVATDEQNFIDFIKDRLGDRVLSINAQRSSDGLPIHHQTERVDANFDCYKIGLEAIMDCFLLARTNLLIRTDSNLSRVSTYLNPSLPVIDI